MGIVTVEMVVLVLVVAVLSAVEDLVAEVVEDWRSFVELEV